MKKNPETGRKVTIVSQLSCQMRGGGHFWGFKKKDLGLEAVKIQHHLVGLPESEVIRSELWEKRSS